MPENRPLTFDHEATLEELAGVGKNRRFDEIIDDEGNEDIQVICKRGDEEIPLSKPSRAFYFGDRNLYDQEAKRYDQEEKARILNTDQFRNNLQVFEELKRSCHRGFVIPFVGAGMSKSAGFGVAPIRRTLYCSIKGVRDESKARGVCAGILPADG